MKKMMKTIRHTILALGVLLSYGVMAQGSEFKWPDDPAVRKTAQEYYTFLSDNCKMKKFADAKMHTVWLLANVPDLNVALYQNASKVFEDLAKNEKDKLKKQGLEDTALWLYDQRIKLYGDEANVLNRKGLKMYSYLSNRPNQEQALYDSYIKILELNGESTYSSNLVSLIELSCKMKSLKRIDESTVLENYEKANQIIEARIASDEKEQAYKDRIDKDFMGCVQIDCEFVKAKILPKFQAEPNIGNAKKLAGMMNSLKCDKDENYFKAAELVVTEEPSPGGMLMLAREAKKSQKYSKSLDYFNKCLTISGLEEKKSEIYFEMADIYVRMGQKENARSYAFKAADAGTSHRSEAYTLVGNLYMSSVKDCDPQSIVLYRSRYIAAYEMFKKAGNSTGMQKAQEQFPSVNELFTENYKVGDSFNTGCWMNENVSLQSR
jgi:tetratricopeptide (TPR) repeat protein